MQIQEIPDWWPCTACRCADREKVSWGDFKSNHERNGDLPDGSPPTFRWHYEVSAVRSCTECNTSARELVVKGACL